MTSILGRVKEIAAEILIDNGAKVDARNVYGDTPLHLAAGENHMAVAELLINRGARVNVRNKLGATPLNVASDPEMQQLLKKHGGKR